MPPRCYFLDVGFDPLNTADAATSIAVRARKLGPFAYVATPNVDHIVRLDKQPSLAPLYDDAWLTLCDSRVLEVFAMASYIDLPAAPGADIVEILFREHIRPTETVTVIGGTQAMADALRRQFGLEDLRWFDAPQGLRDSAEARAACVDFIRANPAPFVFLAVGSPQQEMIAREARLAGVCTGVALCCGAALEFLTGHTKRAPEWMRRARLEWLHRLASSPARMSKRYLVDGPRIFGIWHRWRTEGLGASAAANDMAVSPR